MADELGGYILPGIRALTADDVPLHVVQKMVLNAEIEAKSLCDIAENGRRRFPNGRVTNENIWAIRDLVEHVRNYVQKVLWVVEQHRDRSV